MGREELLPLAGCTIQQTEIGKLQECGGLYDIYAG